MIATCALCNRNIPVSETAEAGFMASGAFCEFFHCADRKACEQAKASKA